MLQPGFGPMFAGDDTYEPGSECKASASELTDSQLVRARVLVVDDHHLISDTLVEILGDEGFDAVAAYDGWQALEIASRFRPDWLLTDVMMPRMNGVELAIAMRQAHPKTAILLFSGQAGVSEILSEGREHGYEFELIAKPVHPMMLIERLKEPR